MTISLRKSYRIYLVRVTTKGGGGGKKTQKIDHVVYGCPCVSRFLSRRVIVEYFLEKLF